MPFLEKVRFVFNCGFTTHWYTSTVQRLTRTVILLERRSPKRLQAKKNEGDSSGKPSLNFTETFKLHFQGPRFTVDDGYLVHSKGRNLQFERLIPLSHASTNPGLTRVNAFICGV